MEVFDGHYYKVAQILLKTMGLWPEQNKYLRWTIVFIFYVSNASLALPEVTKFLFLIR